jgi:8-oxo-dGTP pyrophosphatase MutT (NUDIX family)
VPRPPIPTWCFALVVVRREDRFLLVQEVEEGQPWYLPAGRVEPGESFAEAARREALEEGGIPIVLEGIHRIEHTTYPEGTARLRVFFVARPADDRSPKRVADAESLQASWVTLEETERLSLRAGADLPSLFRRIASGAAVYPLELLGFEAATTVLRSTKV